MYEGGFKVATYIQRVCHGHACTTGWNSRSACHMSQHARILSTWLHCGTARHPWHILMYTPAAKSKILDTFYGALRTKLRAMFSSCSPPLDLEPEATIQLQHACLKMLAPYKHLTVALHVPARPLAPLTNQPRYSQTAWLCYACIRHPSGESDVSNDLVMTACSSPCPGYLKNAVIDRPVNMCRSWW